MRDKIVFVMCLVLSLLALSLAEGGIHNSRDNIDTLLELLSNGQAEVRFQAAEKLGQIAPKQAEVIEALRKAMSDSDYGVRGAAARALYRIGPEALEKAGLSNFIGYDPIEYQAAAAILDQAWSIVNAEYPMFVIREDLDWDALRSKFQGEAKKAKSYQEVGIIIAQMLRHLQDAHVGVKFKGKNLPVFKVLAEVNVNKNTKIYEGLLGGIQPAGMRPMWAKTKDNIGWVMFPRWDKADLPDQFNDVMEQMRDTRGLIVDVRWNSGGDAELSKYVAARFVDTTRVYGYYRHRNGPERTDLTEKIRRQLSPLGPWRYNRPVILLMGQGCISACESFCAMMAVCPNVTTMGDHTRGSTGFPIQFKLDGEIDITVPQWIAYLPDGQLIEGHGIAPDVPFEPKADSFTGTHDELLSLAMERLKQYPLPAKPISGPAIQQYRQREKLDRSRVPKVLALIPQDGKSSVEAVTELRIRFDTAMHPSTINLEWKSGGFQSCEPVRYEPQTNEFIIPIELEPGCKYRIVLNPNQRDNQSGFQSEHRTKAEKFEWTFSTKRVPSSTQSSESKLASDNTADLRKVIENFNQNRRTIHSLRERVLTVECADRGPSGYTSLRSFQSTFMIQGKRAFMADVSDVQMHPFFIFGDGDVLHLYACYKKTDSQEELIFAHPQEFTEQRFDVADPFDAETLDVRPVIREHNLRYSGTADIAGRSCHVITAYKEQAPKDSSVPARQWYIDSKSNMLTKMVVHESPDVLKTTWFAYGRINEAFSYEDLTPARPAYKDVVRIRQLAEPLPDNYTGRFVEIADGSHGEIRCRWGRYGPQSRETTGL